MAAFATVADVASQWRTLTQTESTRAANLLPVISDCLRYEAEKRNYDLDLMVSESNTFATVVNSVTVDICVRALKQSTTATGEPMSQESQSALGYTWSGTYAIPGGANLPILRNDLKRLGITKQRWGALEIYGQDFGY